MNLANEKTVRELALEIPGATRVFEKTGIDYCCGGHRSLSDACASLGVPFAEVNRALQMAAASKTQSGIPDFRMTALTKLIDHIVAKHHAFTKTEVPRLSALIDKVRSAHGEHHPELARIRSIFETLASELEPHMMKEERVLFPYIVQMEQAANEKTAALPSLFGTVRNPIQMMMLEHEGAGYLLKQMREASGDYAVPFDACISYQTLYQALDEFEKDLHQHIHLENNILFPRAGEMELANAAPVS